MLHKPDVQRCSQEIGLKIKLHPTPYKVVRVNNTSLKVHDRCLLTDSIGGFIDTMQCDVLPLKVCHILLG